MLFNSQLGDSFEGVGAVVGRPAALGPRFYDGLAETVGDSFVWRSGIIIRVSGVRVPPPLPPFSISTLKYRPITLDFLIRSESHILGCFVKGCVTSM